MTDIYQAKYENNKQITLKALQPFRIYIYNVYKQINSRLGLNCSKIIKKKKSLQLLTHCMRDHKNKHGILYNKHSTIVTDITALTIWHLITLILSTHA